jgi:nucleolar MIF4G domain-containing protein 1
MHFSDTLHLISVAAVAQGMNTETRRAVFCCVMGAEDLKDAFERLVRLPLWAAQEREIVRVVVECCLRVGNG